VRAARAWAWGRGWSRSRFCVCLSGEIIKASGSFFKRGGRSNFILYCTRIKFLGTVATCELFTVIYMDNIFNNSGKESFISFW
jgi:hypothetical protein